MAIKKRFSDEKADAGEQTPACFLEVESEEAMKVERAFINYMINRLERRIMERKLSGRTRREHAAMIIAKTAERYRGWYKDQVEIETVANFVLIYGRPDSPARIYAELFPYQKIEDFLDSCLNECGELNPVCVRGEDVRRDALNTIK